MYGAVVQAHNKLPDGVVLNIKGREERLTSFFPSSHLTRSYRLEAELL